MTAVLATPPTVKTMPSPMSYATRLPVTQRDRIPGANSAASSEGMLITDSALAVLKKIEALKELEEDWDGEEAPAISTEAIIKALRFAGNATSSVLSSCVGITNVDPAADGGIDLEWRLGDRRLLLSIPQNDECFDILIQIGNVRFLYESITEGDVLTHLVTLFAPYASK